MAAPKGGGVKDLLWENVLAAMKKKYGKENLNALGRDSGIGASGVTRIKERADVRIETLENVASSFGVQPWQLLIKNISPVLERQIVVPRLDNPGSMGRGKELAEQDQVIGQMVLTENWVGMHVSRRTNPVNLRVIAAIGDSMEPTLHDGDLVLVDTGIRGVDVDGIFVLRTSERLFIKRVSTTADRGQVVTSDNPAAPPWGTLAGNADVNIVGRVVWAWNGRKL